MTVEHRRAGAAAKVEGEQHLAKLRADGALGISRPVRVIGRRPDAEQAFRYLEAYFTVAPPSPPSPLVSPSGGAAAPQAELQLPEPVLRAVAELEEGEGAAEVAARLAARPDGQRYAWVVEAASVSVATSTPPVYLTATTEPPTTMGSVVRL